MKASPNSKPIPSRAARAEGVTTTFLAERPGADPDGGSAEHIVWTYGKPQEFGRNDRTAPSGVVTASQNISTMRSFGACIRWIRGSAMCPREVSRRRRESNTHSINEMVEFKSRKFGGRLARRASQYRAAPRIAGEGVTTTLTVERPVAARDQGFPGSYSLN